MISSWRQFQSGEWLTVARLRAYSLVLLTLYALAIVAWIALSHGLSDANGKPLALVAMIALYGVIQYHTARGDSPNLGVAFSATRSDDALQTG